MQDISHSPWSCEGCPFYISHGYIVSATCMTEIISSYIPHHDSTAMPPALSLVLAPTFAVGKLSTLNLSGFDAVSSENVQKTGRPDDGLKSDILSKSDSAGIEAQGRRGRAASTLHVVEERPDNEETKGHRGTPSAMLSLFSVLVTSRWEFGQTRRLATGSPIWYRELELTHTISACHQFSSHLLLIGAALCAWRYSGCLSLLNSDILDSTVNVGAHRTIDIAYVISKVICVLKISEFIVHSEAKNDHCPGGVSVVSW